ncbi:MAG: hypothetical protein NC338_08075 [Firmicutes bacterium]|nr:hypothetical protein [Bacillota bacterium]MCM1401930.1 hypothetical protein [Bacteroides sp.]MCM1477816.1 hypothetical protein [Bacteroides sp.]
MIRAGITGGTSQVAGEIIKLLINHPDVELMWVIDPVAEGAMVSEVHKGLRGETYLRFVAEPADRTDVMFLCFEDPGEAKAFVERNNVGSDVKLIDLSGDYLKQSTFADGDDWIFGLPELCRKPLVRGANKASLPQPLTSAVLLALTPLAKEQWLTSDINITAVVAEENAEPGETLALIDTEQADDIARSIRSLQPDFAPTQMMFVVVNGGWRHGISITAYFTTDHTEQEAIEAFNDYYNDHNFVFLSESLPNLTEVRGTNKCIINVQKVDKRLVVTAVIDDIIKGSSAMAVHDMNLLFGLQERVGLMLKSNC